MVKNPTYTVKIAKMAKNFEGLTHSQLSSTGNHREQAIHTCVPLSPSSIL